MTTQGRRTQQKTMIDLDQIHVETQLYKETHQTLPVNVGVNRRGEMNLELDEETDIESLDTKVTDHGSNTNINKLPYDASPFDEEKREREGGVRFTEV
jgi:hypothetical protein